MPNKRLFIHPCMLWLVCSAQVLFFRFWALMTKYIALNSYANVHSFSLWLIANADVTLESVTQLCLLYKRVTRVRAILSIAADVAFLNIFLKDNYIFRSSSFHYISLVTSPDYLRGCLWTIWRPGQFPPRPGRHWSAPPSPPSPAPQRHSSPWQPPVWERSRQRRWRTRRQRRRTERRVMLI